VPNPTVSHWQGGFHGRRLKPPDAADLVSVGMIVAVGEANEQDREVLWHPGKQEGRLRRSRG
jgi:hypothetical protein